MYLSSGLVEGGLNIFSGVNGVRAGLAVIFHASVLSRALSLSFFSFLVVELYSA